MRAGNSESKCKTTIWLTCSGEVVWIVIRSAMQGGRDSKMPIVLEMTGLPDTHGDAKKNQNCSKPREVSYVSLLLCLRPVSISLLAPYAWSRGRVGGARIPVSLSMNCRNRLSKNHGKDHQHTGFSSQIGTKLRDWAVGQAEAGCYSWAALSSNDSKTR